MGKNKEEKKRLIDRIEWLIEGEDAALAVAYDHTGDGNKVCYARSLGQVTLRHGYSGTATEVFLRCTEPLDHEGDHVDNMCCWKEHRFTEDMAGPPEPEWQSWERCTACKQTWPCDVEKMRLALTAKFDTDA